MGKTRIDAFAAFEPDWWESTDTFLAFGAADTAHEADVAGVDRAFGWPSATDLAPLFSDLYRWRLDGTEPTLADDRLRLYQDLQALSPDPVTTVDVTVHSPDNQQVFYEVAVGQEDRPPLSVGAEWGLLIGLNDGARFRADHDKYIIDEDFSRYHPEFRNTPPTDRRYATVPGDEEPAWCHGHIPPATPAHDRLDESSFTAAAAEVTPLSEARELASRFAGMYDQVTNDSNGAAVAPQFIENFRQLEAENDTYLLHTDRAWGRAERRFRQENGLLNDVPEPLQLAVDRYSIPTILNDMLAARDDEYAFFIETAPVDPQYRLFNDGDRMSPDPFVEAVPTAVTVKRFHDGTDEVYELPGDYAPVFLPSDADLYHRHDGRASAVLDYATPQQEPEPVDADSEASSVGKMYQ